MDDDFKEKVKRTLADAKRIPWFRVKQFLEVSMLEMVRQINPPPKDCIYTIGKRSGKSLVLPPGLHEICTSEHNEGAQARFNEVKRFMKEDTKRYPEDLTRNLIWTALEQRPANLRKPFERLGARDKVTNRASTFLVRLSHAGAQRLSSHAGASTRPSRLSASSYVGPRPSCTAAPVRGGTDVSWESPPPSPPEAGEAEQPTADEAKVFLLYLDARTWSQDGPEAVQRRAKLAHDVGTAMERKMQIVLVHEDDTDERDEKDLHPAAFQTIMDRTPQTLKRWGLYRKLAVALHGNRDCRRVSAHLILEQIAEALRSGPKQHAEPPPDEESWMSQLDKELKLKADTGSSDEARKRAQAWWGSLVERKSKWVLIGSEDRKDLGGRHGQAADTRQVFAREGEKFVADIDDGDDVDDMCFNPHLNELAAKRVADGGSAPAPATDQEPKMAAPGNKSAWQKLRIDLSVKTEKTGVDMSASLRELKQMEEDLDVKKVPKELEKVPGLVQLVYQASQLEMNRGDPDPPKRQQPATGKARSGRRQSVNAGRAGVPTNFAEESGPPSATVTKPRAASSVSTTARQSPP